jgi:hypothetical protein
MKKEKKISTKRQCRIRLDMLRKWARAILVGAKDKKNKPIKSLMRRNAMFLTRFVKCLKQISHA